MTTTFNLPDLGEGLADAEIVQWHVKEGDEIIVDQPMVSVETAKAVVDVPSPWSGKIIKLYAQAKDVVEVGKPLVEFALSDSKAVSSSSTQSPEPTVHSLDQGSVVGTMRVGTEEL